MNSYTDEPLLSKNNRLTVYPIKQEKFGCPINNKWLLFGQQKKLTSVKIGTIFKNYLKRTTLYYYDSCFLCK